MASEGILHVQFAQLVGVFHKFGEIFIHLKCLNLQYFVRKDA